MKIVVMCGSYMPNYSAVGICAKNIVDEFLRMGHEVYVIAERTAAPITEEHKEIIRHISTPLFELYFSKNKYVRLSYRIIRYLGAVFSLQNIKKDIMKAYLKELEDIHRESPIGLIVPFCFPFEGCYAASYFVQKFREIALIPFLMDRFTASTSIHRFKLNALLKKRNHLHAENIVFRMSNKVFILPSWERHICNYLSDFYDKVILSEHPLLKKIKDENDVAFDTKKINISYTGSLLKKVRDPEKALYVIDRLLFFRKDIVFHFFIVGDCNTIINELANKYPNNVINHGAVKVKTAHSAMCRSDYLLSVGNKDITQFASKNFEYISTGKPIIHFYKSCDDPVNEFLKKYNNSVLISESIETEHAFSTLNEFINQKHISYDFDYVENLFKDASPKYTCDQIIGNI